MNVVEAYIKFRGQLIILMSGITGCKKTKFAKMLAKEFSIKFVDQMDYYVEKYDEKIDMPDGTKIINWYSDNAIDWDKLNTDINKYKNTGVIVTGFSFSKDRIDFDSDFHIHIKLSKKLCIEKRRKFLQKYQKKYPDEYSVINTEKELLLMNKLIYPYYLESLKNSSINKFINMDELDDEKAYDTIFDSVIEYIQDWHSKNRQVDKTESIGDIETTSSAKNTSNNAISNDSDDSDIVDEENGPVLFQRYKTR